MKSDGGLELLTPRLRLCLWRDDDIEGLLRMCADEEVMRHIPNRLPPDREIVKERLEKDQRHWREHGFGLWAVEERETGAFMGRAGLQILPGSDPQVIEIGFLLLREFWGKGFATEAAQATLWFGFTQLAAPEIVGLTMEGNTASQSVLKKVGMVLRGRGHWYGTEMLKFGLVRGDWTDPGLEIRTRNAPLTA